MKSLGIVGSRDFDDYELMCKMLDPLHFSIVVSGGANGADNLAEKYAWEHNKQLKLFLPNWSGYGKKAGYIRNKEIVQNSDGVIAFWNGYSKGTQLTLSICEELGKPYKIVYFPF